MQRIYNTAYEFMRSYTQHAHNKVKIKASDWVATVGSGTKVWIQCRSNTFPPTFCKTPECEHINLSLNFTGFSPTSGESFWKIPCVDNANLATTHYLLMLCYLRQRLGGMMYVPRKSVKLQRFCKIIYSVYPKSNFKKTWHQAENYSLLCNPL